MRRNSRERPSCILKRAKIVFGTKSWTQMNNKSMFSRQSYLLLYTYMKNRQNKQICSRTGTIFESRESIACVVWPTWNQDWILLNGISFIYKIRWEYASNAICITHLSFEKYTYNISKLNKDFHRICARL